MQSRSASKKKEKQKGSIMIELEDESSSKSGSEGGEMEVEEEERSAPVIEEKSSSANSGEEEVEEEEEEEETPVPVSSSKKGKKSKKSSSRKKKPPSKKKSSHRTPPILPNTSKESTKARKSDPPAPPAKKPPPVVNKTVHCIDVITLTVNGFDKGCLLMLTKSASVLEIYCVLLDTTTQNMISPFFEHDVILTPDLTLKSTSDALAGCVSNAIHIVTAWNQFHSRLDEGAVFPPDKGPIMGEDGEPVEVDPTLRLINTSLINRIIAAISQTFYYLSVAGDPMPCAEGDNLLIGRPVVMSVATQRTNHKEQLNVLDAMLCARGRDMPRVATPEMLDSHSIFIRWVNSNDGQTKRLEHWLEVYEACVQQKESKIKDYRGSLLNHFWERQTAIPVRPIWCSQSFAPPSNNTTGIPSLSSNSAPPSTSGKSLPSFASNCARISSLCPQSSTCTVSFLAVRLVSTMISIWMISTPSSPG